MIKKEQILEDLAFVFDGTSFVCPNCPSGLKFGLDELTKMKDPIFIATMTEHEKHHKVGFAKVLTKYTVKPVAQKKIDTTVKEKAAPVKSESKVPAKTTPPAAIPKKLMDAGLRQHLLAPKQAFIASGGKEHEFVREINYAMQALMNNDHLLSCAKSNPEHFVEAIKNVGLSGLSLSPELKLGYLVPRKGKIYFNSSYMGKSEIITRGGSVKKVYAKLVFAGEEFVIHEGTQNRIVHNPDPWAKKTIENLKGGYWVCQLANGEVLFDTMPKERIEEIRDMYSEGYGAKTGFTPWENDSEALEMARKTVINWGFKFMPKTGLSPQQVKALEVTGEYDSAVYEEHKKSQDPKADQFAEDGPAEDGQIIDITPES